MRPEADGSSASWWLEQLAPWTHGVSSLVPSSFQAVCKVLHPWWGPEGEPVRWRTLAEHPDVAGHLGDGSSARDDHVRAVASREDLGQASTGYLDDLTAAAIVDVLKGGTTTPDDVLVAVWEGWGDEFPGAAHLATENRGHFLLRGPLPGVLTPVMVRGPAVSTPGLWWPADRAWFVASEIDFEWTFVAGAATLVDRLLEDERLEVVLTTFDAPDNRALEHP